MVDIQTERVLNAVIDALFDDAGDDCPKKRMAYRIMENIRQANNQEIIEQLGGIPGTPCDLNCRHRQKSR